MVFSYSVKGFSRYAHRSIRAEKPAMHRRGTGNTGAYANGAGSPLHHWRARSGWREHREKNPAI
jgi:hypothetical protein